VTGPRLVQAVLLSAAVLRARAGGKRLLRRLRLRGAVRSRGSCPLCEREVEFAATGAGERESPVCLRCGSVPRQRALVAALPLLAPPLDGVRLHESSPSPCTFFHFGRRCRGFTASCHLPGLAPGTRVGAFVAADLERQPFPGGSFDVVVTLDVLEHVPRPLPALAEVARTLTPAGVHVFTAPRAASRTTGARVRFVGGQPEPVAAPEYHRDPFSRAGALVVTDFGCDFEALVARELGLVCTAAVVVAPELGVPSPVEVFAVRRA